MNISHSLIAILAISTLQATDNLGTINITSSTIDNKFNAKKLNVSNTATLNTKEIEEMHQENLANILNTIPGVTARQNEGDSNKIHIRGIATEMYMGEKPGVAIVIDGVPVQERAGSVNIDSDNIASIKVIKGGASYLYGNDALSGAVIITTKRPKNKTEGSFTFEKGSDGYEKKVANFRGATDYLALNLQASQKESDGYWESSDYWAKSINGKIQYYIDDTSDITLGIDKSKRYENDTGSITHTVSGVNQVKKNPTSIGEVGYATDYNIELDKYFLTYSKDFMNGSNFMTQIYSYEDTTENKNGAYDGIANNDLLRDDHLYDSYANTKQKGLKSEFRKNGDKIASMFGIDLARNDEEKNSEYRVDYTSRGTTHYIGEITSDTDSKEKINAAYGELKFGVTDKLLLSSNIRVDRIAYDYTNNLTDTKWDKDFQETSYKLGATYKFNENSILYTNTSTGFRVPTLAQMYAGDMTTSTYSGTYSNNTDIKTETTVNYELGYRGKTDFISYDIAVYQLNRDDVIGRSSGNYASTKGVEVTYDNMADIRNRGLELSLNSDTKKTFSYSINYTFLNSKYTRYDEYNLILNEGGVVDQNSDGDTDDDYVASTHDLKGNITPRTSKHTIVLTTNYKILDNLMVTAEINYRSSQYADELNKIKISGYSVTNLRTKYDLKIAGFQTQFFAQIDNLFDKQYYMMPRVTGDRNDDNIYDIGDMGLTVNPGRTYLAGLTVKF
ncbi:TonB-dependent receptor [Arcobacteraceae bacterium]|nr:TonB-dependent receptor [Arcobacteraceae bacterium]